MSTAAEQGNGDSINATVSGDGRLIAFESAATNLVKGDSNGVNDIFVRDQVSGTTARVSVNSKGRQANGRSRLADVSRQGGFVVFQSDASNLVSGDRNAQTDVFLHDLTTGATSRVSVGPSGVEGNNKSEFPSVSADGRFVAFLSSASNLVAGDANGQPDVFVRDVATGTTTRVSVNSAGGEANGPSSGQTAISDDGRYVSFASDATNLVGDDANGATDVFLHDGTTGATVRVSVSSFREEGDGDSEAPSISADGRLVTFTSGATNLGPNDFNNVLDVFVHEVDTGLTSRVSLSSSGDDANGHSLASEISGDGRHVVFHSRATNIVVPDNNPATQSAVRDDVFLHDRTSGTTQVVSVSSSGSQALGEHGFAQISGDGRYVVFRSSATTLVSGDTNNVLDVFLRDRGPQPGAPAALVDVPVEGDRVFGAQSLAATVDASFGAARVDFKVDGAIVGSDDAAPYSVQWDSTTVPDGDHSVTATAVASGGATSESSPISFEVVNAAACDERLHADFEAGRIDVDTYVKNGMYCVLEPRLLSQRHSSPNDSFNSESAHSRFIAQLNNTSQQTQDEMTALFSAIDAGFYATLLEGGSGAAQADAPASVAASSQVSCVDGSGFRGLATRWCQYTTSDNQFLFRFAPDGYTNGIPMGDADSNGIPDKVDRIENSLREALAKYTGPADDTDTVCDASPLGFRAPEGRIDVNLWRAVGQRSAGYAPPPAFYNTDIYLASDAQDDIYLPRHELFHVIQWGYASFADWQQRQGTSMWMEATAEWAAHQALPSDTRYAASLPEFLGAPHVELEHGSIFDSDDREYGAFILAEYLEERIDCSFIRRSWERVAVDDELGALEAIDAVLRTQEGLAGGLADVLPDFWQRNYRLQSGPLGYQDVDLSQWKNILRADARTAGDATVLEPRPLRQRVPLIGGRDATGFTIVERGGASYVDFVHDFGRPAALTLRVGNRSPFGGLTSDGVKLTLLSFAAYPALCQSPVDLSFENGVVRTTVQLDSTCTFSTLIVHNNDIAGGTKIQDWSARLNVAPQPGDVFVSTAFGHVLIYTPNGRQIGTWNTRQPGFASGSAFDASGNFYVTNFTAGGVTRFGPDGTLLGFFSTKGNPFAPNPFPESIFFGPNGNAYIGHAEGGIQERTPEGTLIQTFTVATEDRGSGWIALRPDGCTVVYTSEGTRVLQYDICTSQQLADFATMPVRAYAIALLPDGGAVVAADTVIRRFNSAGTQVRTYDEGTHNEWFALGLDPDGISFWAGDGVTGEAFRFDVETGQVLESVDIGITSAFPGFEAIGGITVMPDLAIPASARVGASSVSDRNVPDAPSDLGALGAT